jgi:membrane-associated phospholipid phosphatase
MTHAAQIVTMRLTNELLGGLAAALMLGSPAHGQSADSVRTASAVVPSVPSRRLLWSASSALLVTSLILDERIRPVLLAHHSAQLDRLAAGADVLGTAVHIVPALAATYVGSRALGKNTFAEATLRVGLSYAAADAVESLLKPAIGRMRPYLGGEPLTFRPFSANGDFHSFPSAHVVHIASLATAVAMEANRGWVTTLASVATTYVGVQRVYRDQHWSSDVVASGMLGMEVAGATLHWLSARHARESR